MTFEILNLGVIDSGISVLCEIAEGDGATVGVGEGEGDGATVGVGEVEGDGATVGVGEGLVVKEGAGVATLNLTPLFQTNCLFFLMQVKRNPLET